MKDYMEIIEYTNNSETMLKCYKAIGQRMLKQLALDK